MPNKIFITTTTIIESKYFSKLKYSPFIETVALSQQQNNKTQQFIRRRHLIIQNRYTRYNFSRINNHSLRFITIHHSYTLKVYPEFLYHD